jgi:hypothetical protein
MSYWKKSIFLNFGKCEIQSPLEENATGTE